MPTMNVSLTAALLKQVQSKVESGQYNNASEVVRDAIRQMDANGELLYQLKLARLKEALAEGIAQAKAGEVSEYSMNQLLDDLKKGL